jgi:hypothetical protein
MGSGSGRAVVRASPVCLCVRVSQVSGVSVVSEFEKGWGKGGGEAAPVPGITG